MICTDTRRLRSSYTASVNKDVKTECPWMAELGKRISWLQKYRCPLA